MKGAYTRSNISGKEKVGLSAGEPIRWGGLIGGEIRYRSFKFSQNWLSKHTTSHILVPKPFSMSSDLVYLNLYNSGNRRDIEKQ